MGRPTSFLKPTLLLFACAAATLLASGCGDAEPKEIPRYDHKVVNSYPHDPKAYCQGILFHEGVFYESTGRRGTSGIRRVEIETGKVLQEKALPPALFGEGLVLHDDRLTQLTWESGSAHSFDRETFKVLQNYRYEGEGWGITTTGKELVMSNGSSTLSVRDPDTFEELRQVKVTLNGGPLTQLNELEWVDGEVWANVWKTNQIVRIDLETGQVIGIIHLEGIFDNSVIPDTDAVLNGIAYDAEAKRVFVTGKLWPKVFEIELVPRKK